MQISKLAKGRKLNWRPSLKGHHIKKYAHMELSSAPMMLPPSVDLRPSQSPVWDQGQTGSCSGFSTKSHLEALQIKLIQANAPKGPFIWTPGKLTPISAFFPYWNERAVEGSTSTDAGASTLLDMCTALQAKGACAESTWPSDGPLVTTCPTSAAYGEAYHHKLPNFYSLEGIAELKRCLSNGFGHLFGIPVYDSFMGEHAASTGIIPFPAVSENIQGGHALYCVGYSDAHQWFIFKNSWSSQWGDNGYGYLPYDYMMKLADDFLTLRLAPASVAA